MNLFESQATESRVYTLRDYQQEASDAAIEFFNDPRKKSGTIVMPTGCGKSLIIADVVNRLSGNTLVFQPQKELLEQNYEKYMSYDPYANSAVFSASMNSKEIAKVTYATIGSVINKKEAFRHFDNIIVDENHYVNPKQGLYKKLFEYLGDKKYCGFSATPFRAATNSFGTELRFITRTRPRVFDEVLYYSQISDIKERGFLANMEYYPVKDDFNTDMLQVNSTRMDYTDDSVRSYYNEIHFDEKVADVANRLLKAGRKHILVFTKFVKEAEAVAKALGGKCATVSSGMHKDDRKRVLTDFKDGRIKVVANVGVLTTGFDFPALDTVLLARPTRSLALYYQMIGRAMRPHPSKKSAWVVDMCGTYERFGRVERLRLANDGGNKWYYHIGGKQLTNVYLD